MFLFRKVFVVFAAFGILVSTNPVNAKTTAGEYQDMLRDPESMEYTVASVFVHGLSQGILVSNTANEHHNLPKLVCQPARLAVVGQQSVNIFLQFMAKNPDVRDEPMPVVMLFALQDALPC